MFFRILNYRVVLGLGLLSASFLSISEAFSYEIKSDMAIDPAFEERAEIHQFLPEFKSIWLQALARPELDYQRRAIFALTEAHRQGMPDLEDTAERMSALVSAPETHPVTRQAATLALIEFDDSTAAAALDEAAQKHGIKMARLVEPQLAAWDYQPIRARWRARLSDPAASHEQQALAIAALGTVADQAAIEPLRKLLLAADTPADLRLASARALGSIGDQQTKADAQRLAPSSDMIDRLCAVSLLARQQDEAARDLFVALANDEEPAIAAVALQRIHDVDPALAAPLWSKLAENPDAKVRRLLAGIMHQDAKPESISRLAKMLDDPHPGVRDDATDALIDLAARAEFDVLVREAMTSILAGRQARPLELAIIVLGTLRHEPAADRLVELLTFEEANVSIAAGWALSRLALPETGPAILALVERQFRETDEAARELNADPGTFDVPDFTSMYLQHEHLLIALCKMQHEPAAPLLQKYLPKPPLLKDTDPPYVETYRQQQLRAAAIWALGKFYGKEASVELSDAIFERAIDESFTNAESSEVRAAACVALARFGRDDDETIKLFTELRDSEYTHERLAAAAAWAIGELTGEPAKPLPPRVNTRLDWFLRPLKNGVSK